MTIQDYLGPADPELYAALLRERYGPLRQVFAERHRRIPRNPDPAVRPVRADPEAARHRAELAAAIGCRRGGKPEAHSGPPASAERRTPPVPGSVWCKACDSWCTPSGICRCNNR